MSSFKRAVRFQFGDGTSTDSKTESLAPSASMLAVAASTADARGSGDASAPAGRSFFDRKHSAASEPTENDQPMPQPRSSRPPQIATSVPATAVHEDELPSPMAIAIQAQAEAYKRRTFEVQSQLEALRLETRTYRNNCKTGMSSRLYQFECFLPVNSCLCSIGAGRETITKLEKDGETKRLKLTSAGASLERLQKSVTDTRARAYKSENERKVRLISFYERDLLMFALWLQIGQVRVERQTEEIRKEMYDRFALRAW